eukprot:4213790-Pleurochrysis_carterae.AAC.1
MASYGPWGCPSRDSPMLDQSHLAKESAISAPGAVPGHTPAPNPLCRLEETSTKWGKWIQTNSMQ